MSTPEELPLDAPIFLHLEGTMGYLLTVKSTCRVFVMQTAHDDVSMFTTPATKVPTRPEREAYLRSCMVAGAI